MERLIAFIIARRHELGFSQRALARRAGINAGTLSSIEAGKVTKAPTIATLEKLAHGLKLTPDALISIVKDSESYPNTPATFDSPTARELIAPSLDEWERAVLEKIDTLDLTTFEPRRGRLIWQLDRPSRRRVLRHLEALWDETQEYLLRARPL